MFWSCYLFLYFFRPFIFQRPWADFRETLPHYAVCTEIIDLLLGCSYGRNGIFEHVENRATEKNKTTEA